MSVAASPGTAGQSEIDRLRTLYQLLAALNKTNALEDIFDAALTSLLEATAADRAAIQLFDDDDVIRFQAARGLSAGYQHAVTGHSPWLRGERDALPVAISDCLLDRSLSRFRNALEREGIRALAFIPLALEAGVFGQFMLCCSEPHECAEEELGIAQVIAAHIALATDRKRSEIARVATELRLRAIVDNPARLDPEKVLDEIAGIVTPMLGAEFGKFFHNSANETPGIRGGGVARFDDVTLDPRFDENNPHHRFPEGSRPVRSYLATPVVTRSGEVLGSLVFGHHEPGKFTPDHEVVAAAMAAQAAIAVENARLFEQSRWARSELTRTNQELRRANRDLELFAYAASHDLQEPVRNIALSAQLIERGWGSRLQGEDAAFLNNILAASKRMGVLIHDLLAYTDATRYEEGPPPSVDPAPVLAEVLATLRAAIDDSGAIVTAGRLPPTTIHRSRLAWLFSNLIGNAIKFRDTREEPRVHITADERGGWCVFSVADNGIGIEPQYADQIFGLFTRLHGREKYSGSGIGLAICKRTVEQYGGRIWLEHSALDQGSTFCFSIPSRGRHI